MQPLHYMRQTGHLSLEIINLTRLFHASRIEMESSAVSMRNSRDRGPLERHVSAGGVVYRDNQGEIEVVLCGRTTPTLWGLPKGTPDPGESVEQTAIREVNEETGLEVDIQQPLGSIHYWFQRDGVRIDKTVHFYLMRARGGSPENHDPEFDIVSWFPAETALRTLTHASEARIVRKAMELIPREGEQ